MKEKGFHLLLLRVFSLSLKMTLERKRQSWKGTRKKVRFLPRELKRFKIQCKSAVNAFGRNMLPLGTGNWPADTVNYSQGKKNIAWKDINWKETQWPSFPLLSWFILSPFSETLPHISKMPSFPRSSSWSVEGHRVWEALGCHLYMPFTYSVYIYCMPAMRQASLQTLVIQRGTKQTQIPEFRELRFYYSTFCIKL